MQKNRTIAYFSMEFAFNDDIPNYSGGLGVLAGDIMHSSADLGKAVVGVGLIYHLDDDKSKGFSPGSYMEKSRQRIMVEIEDREVQAAIWEMRIKGKSQEGAKVYFLDTNLEENPRWDRDLTKNIYPGDPYTRLAQEAVLGIGGVRALKALGYKIDNYHLNEGHGALAVLEILKENKGDIEAVRRCCTFTTHTPSASGHDYFDYNLVEKTVGKHLPQNIRELSLNDKLGMTQLALNLSRRANSVSMKHNEVCRGLFPGYDFLNITNGIHHRRWAGRHMDALFSRQIGGWRDQPEKLANAVGISDNALKKARQKEKRDLIKWINKQPAFFPLPEIAGKDRLDEAVFTIGFARRLVPYKRPDLILRDLSRLREIGAGRLQLVFAGNIYKGDGFSNYISDLIKKSALELRGQVKIAFIQRHNLDIAKRLVAGCDAWLNNPCIGTEASGTSGMKASLNGLPNISTMDGWWNEAYRKDNISGWGFGEFVDGPDREASDYGQLMDNVAAAIDCYYSRPDEWAIKARHAIALIAYFNTNRVLKEYFSKMWQRE